MWPFMRKDKALMNEWNTLPDQPNMRSSKTSLKRALDSLTFLLFIFMLINAGGCTHMAMDSVINSWRDQQSSEVIAAWGKPSEELKIEGKRLLLWNTIDGTLSDTKKPSLKPDSRYCTRLLEVGRNDKINHGAWEGNDCPGLFSGWKR